jgi:glutathione S-transferase
MSPRLVTIPFSHFCEKARWALDRAGLAYEEEAHAPIVHMPFAMRTGGGHTVPILVTRERTIPDSTEILRWADGRLAPEHRLFGAAGAELAEIEAWEDEFDRRLGPATRVLGYYHLLPRPDLAKRLLRGALPAWERAVVGVGFPAAAAMMRRGMRIDADNAARSLEITRAIFARVGDRLAGGRRYLVGDRFSAADLAFASLATPVLFPREHAHILGDLDAMPEGSRALALEMRATRAGEHALRLYAEERAVVLPALAAPRVGR